MQQLQENWSWLVDPSLSVFMCAASGDVFFEDSAGEIHWLDTGCGEITKIAESREKFLTALRADQGKKWLLAPVINELIDTGIFLETDQCYGFKVLPLLGGEYTIDNMVPMSAAGWYGFSGYMHLQLKDLPDGKQVQLSVA